MLLLSDGMRLKSFSSMTKGTKGTVKIEVEIDDLWNMGYFLRGLAELEAEQKAKAAEARKPKAKPEPRKQRQLALPAPRLALPGPDDEGLA